MPYLVSQEAVGLTFYYNLVFLPPDLPSAYPAHCAFVFRMAQGQRAKIMAADQALGSDGHFFYFQILLYPTVSMPV
jgi:hypothetical protein